MGEKRAGENETLLYFTYLFLNFIYPRSGDSDIYLVMY